MLVQFPYLLFFATFHTLYKLGVDGFQFLRAAITLVVMATMTWPVLITARELHVTTSLVVIAQPISFLDIIAIIVRVLGTWVVVFRRVFTGKFR